MSTAGALAWMLKTSSMGMAKGRFTGRCGAGTLSSTACMRRFTDSVPLGVSSPFSAAKAEPCMHVDLVIPHLLVSTTLSRCGGQIKGTETLGQGKGGLDLVETLAATLHS